MEFELNRVGILDSGIFQWHLTFNTILEKKFHNYLKEKNAQNEKQIGILNYSINLGHYECIRDAYYNKYRRILIIEDDERFLKDLNQIEQILENIPQDQHIILFDKMISRGALVAQFVSINNYFCDFYSAFSAGCYALDRKGMKKMMEMLQTLPLNIDGFFAHKGFYFGDFGVCCSKKNLAVQAVYRNSYTIKDLYRTDSPYSFQQYYKALEINFDDYMMREDGAPYYYGSYIDDKIEESSEKIFLTEDENQFVNVKDIIEPEQINVFLAVSTDAMFTLYPLLYSLTKYSQSKFNVYIMLDKQNIEQYYRLFEPLKNERLKITLLDNKLLNQYLNLSQNDIINRTTIVYAPLLIPTLFPNLDRILYLDYDTIIIKKGIEWLYNIDLENKYLVAREEKLQLFRNDDPNIPFELNIFKHFSEKYFNSGVMVFNIQKMIKDGKDKEMLKIISDPPTSKNNKILAQIKKEMGLKEEQVVRFKLWDQSLLNYLFRDNDISWCNNIFNYGEINLFAPIYVDIENVKNNWNFKNFQDFIDNIIIEHFCGDDKPWRLEEDPLYNSTFQKQAHKNYKTLQKQVAKKLNEYYMV